MLFFKWQILVFMPIQHVITANVCGKFAQAWGSEPIFITPSSVSLTFVSLHFPPVVEHPNNTFLRLGGGACC